MQSKVVLTALLCVFDTGHREPCCFACLNAKRNCHVCSGHARSHGRERTTSGSFSALIVNNPYPRSAATRWTASQGALTCNIRKSHIPRDLGLWRVLGEDCFRSRILIIWLVHRKFVLCFQSRSLSNRLMARAPKWNQFCFHSLEIPIS